MTFASELRVLREKYGVRCDNCTFGDFEGSNRRCTLKWDFTSENDWCESWQAKPKPVVEKPPCKGFSWVGQGMDHCERCGRDITEHEGLLWLKPGQGPFSGKRGEEPEHVIIPFDEARKRIPLFGHYVTPIGVPDDYAGPYRYDKADGWVTE